MILALRNGGLPKRYAPFARQYSAGRIDKGAISMETSLKCSKCGEKYPSKFWFKVSGICVDCYARLTDTEKMAYATTEPPTSATLRSFPSASSAFLVPVSSWFLSIFISMLTYPLLSALPREMRAFTVYTIVYGCLLLIFASLRRTQIGNGTRLFQFGRPAIEPWLLSIGAVFCAMVGFLAILAIYGQLSPPVTPRPQHYTFLLSPYHIATAVVLAPAIEELLFRGIVLDSLLRKYSPAKAILISALVFALAHDPARMPLAFVLGLVIG